MKNKRLFLLLMFMCVPTLAFADVDTSSISNANDIAGADKAYIEAIQKITNEDSEKISEAETHVKNILDSVLKQTDTRTAEEKNQAMSEKQDAYNAAKEKEQSLANRTLTALSTAATGIGGMELAMGLSEQKADKAAEADMTAYLETFRCTYGDGKQVKAGPEEIELPGGNDAEFMNLRAEYMALATDLKERKEALGMKPGLESEAIMDKAQMGLYDSENIGITNGAYASLYRAMALGSESDQAKIDEEKKASKNRVIAGAVVGGVGVVGSMVGNSLINGKLGELIKEKKEKKKLKTSSAIERDELIKTLSDADLQKYIQKYKE